MDSRTRTSSSGFMDSHVMSKLTQFRINHEPSLKELKSLIKDVQTEAYTGDDVASSGFESENVMWKSFITSVQSQLSTTTFEDVPNTSMFIKTISEMQIPQSSDQPKQVNNWNYIDTHLLRPLVPAFMDYIIITLKRQVEIPDANLSTTALHQVLGVIHKTVRTSLSVLKRTDSVIKVQYCDSETSKHIQDKVKHLVVNMCNLLVNPFLESELDIKCSVGLAICLGLKLLHGELAFKTFDLIFSSHADSGQSSVSLDPTEEQVLEVSHHPVNRIAIAFGVLNLIDPGDGVTSIKLLKSIGENILQIEHGTKEAVSLGSARIIETWMIKLNAMDPSHFTEVKHLFPEIEFFLFNNLAGHIDAVKGCCRCIIALVAKVYDLMDDDYGKSNHVKEFLERFLPKPVHVKWAGISWTAKSTAKSLCLLELVNSVPDMLLNTERIFKNAANDTYIALMGYHFDVVGVQEWTTTWIDPLFHTHKVQSCESNWTQKRTIICGLLKSDRKDLTSALMKCILDKISSPNMKCPEASQLAVEAVKVASDLGIQMDGLSNHVNANGPDSFQGIIPRAVLNSWLWSGNAQARIAAFSLIVDTKKTSDPISIFDFKSIRLFLRYNLVSQNPAFRQQYLSHFKKLLRRLHDSFNLVKRKRDNTTDLENYQNFFHWLWKSYTEDIGLFPGANFARRCQALECLAEFTSLFDFKLFTVSESAAEHVKYIRWLSDSYENNKIMGFKVLEKMPIPAFDNQSFADKFMENAIALCASVKPPESVTGRYLVVFIMKKCPSIPPLTVLLRLYEKLEDIVKSIEETSLMEVSGHIAIYGYISCIRMILDKQSKEHLISKGEYRDLASKLMSVCFKLNHIFFPLLGCAAPEGTVIDMPEENDFHPRIVRSIGAQKMLVCSWRSMRDACHLMNEMCSLFPLEGEKEEHVLSFEQVERIGNHQLFLLKNLMHRGVFEQIFVGFKLLADRLYKSTGGRLNKLIDKWLELALDEDLMNSKSVTRRSAGLPFILQALLAPGAGNESFICKYVNGLFSKESDSPQVRIHVMNVLRALFRDASFSKAMMPFVPSGLRRAFKAQASNYWPEQNSGLMLLGAVVRRTFGPHLNSMSASTFFRKFPEMYEFLLGEVRTCGQKMKEENLAEQFLDFTFYVLVLLSSFATKGVVEDAHFPLHKFVSCIRDCGASEDVRVRKVAAKALIPFLLDPASQIETINAILNDLKKLKLSTYKVHGDLCALLAIYQAIPKDRRLTEVRSSIVNGLMETHKSILNQATPLVFETMAEICAELGHEAKLLIMNVLKGFNVNFRSIQNRQSIPDLPNAVRKLIEVKIIFDLADEQNTCRMVYDWIRSQDLVFVEQLLSLLCSEKILIFEEESSSIILNALVRKYAATDFYYEGQRKIEELFLQLFCNIPELVYKDWLKFVLEPDGRTLPEFFEKVLHICEMESGTMICKALAAELLGKLAFKIEAELSNDHQDRFCHSVSLLCDSKSYDQIRFGVAKCLPSLKLDNNFRMFTVSQQCKLWYTLLILAQDDEYFVREEINSKHDSEFGTFCDIKLIENLIQLFFNNFVINHMDEGLTLLMGIILRDDYIVAEEADDSEEERLFDKSEINSFNEPLHVAKLVHEFLDQNTKLRDECRNIFHNMKLNSDLVELYEFTSNSVVTKSNVELTLHDLCSHQIVRQGQETLSDFILSNKLNIQNAVRKFLLDVFS